jgi:hypothetical protein
MEKLTTTRKRAAYPHVEDAVGPASSAISEFESTAANARANDAAD